MGYAKLDLRRVKCGRCTGLRGQSAINMLSPDKYCNFVICSSSKCYRLRVLFYLVPSYLKMFIGFPYYDQVDIISIRNNAMKAENIMCRDRKPYTNVPVS